MTHGILMSLRPESGVAKIQLGVGVGILCSITAWVAFSLGDVGVKYLSADYPLHELMMLRTVFAFSITAGIFIPLEGGFSSLKTQHLVLHLSRGLCVVMANLLFFTGLASLTLPEATSIFFIAPLFITVLSFFILNEQVGRYRWFAVLMGMTGVIVMLRPGGDTFRAAGLLPLMAAFAYACLQILTRKIGIRDKASTMSFYIQFVFVIVCGSFGLLFGDGYYANPDNPAIDFLFRAWVWPNLSDLLVIAGMGIGAASGGYLISQAYRISPAAIIAPFEYIALLLSILWSVLIFNEWPDAVAWVGILLILAGGLLVLWRELASGKNIVTGQPMRKPR